MTRLTAVVVVLTLTLPTLASGAGWTAKNRCSDAVRILRTSIGQTYKDKDVDPAQVRGAIGHFNQVAENYKRAQAQLAQVPEDQFDKSDPELKECVDMMADWGQYLATLRGKIEAAAKGAQTLAPFLEQVKGKERTLFTLAAVEYAPKADVLNAMKAPEAKRMLTELGAIEPSCNEFESEAMPPAKVPGVMGSVYRVAQVEMSSELAKKPAAWCYVARHRVELMTRAAANRFVFVEGYGNYRVLLAEAVKKTSAEHPDMDSWLAEMVLKPEPFFAARRQAEASFYRELGIEQPAEGEANPIKEQLAELGEKIDAAAPDVKFPSGGGHDGAIEGRARGALKKIFASAVVKAAVMDEAVWTIEKNALGVPLRRFRSGQLLFKRPESKWCLQRTFSYVEEYRGGGGFQSGAEVNVLPATRFLACKE